MEVPNSELSNSSNDDVPHVNFYVEKTNRENDVKTLMMHLKQWDPRKTFQKWLSGGFVNEVIKCWNERNPNEIVVVRIWFEEIRLLEEKRDMEIKCVKVLSKRGCFSKLHGTFKNGYCYEYYNGQCLAHTLDKVFETNTTRAVAKGLAFLHATEVPNVPKESWMLKKIENMKKSISLDQWKEITRQAPELPPMEEFFKDLDSVIKMTESLGSPIVLCHGDPHFANMIWNFKDDHVTFVDSDLTGFNYQHADIAYHFYSYHYDEVFGRDICPEDEESFRKCWILEYLKSWYELTGRNARDISDDDVKQMDILVKKFSLLTCLMICALCFHSSRATLRNLDSIQLARKMYVYYKQHRETFWNL